MYHKFLHYSLYLKIDLAAWLRQGHADVGLFQQSTISIVAFGKERCGDTVVHSERHGWSIYWVADEEPDGRIGIRVAEDVREGPSQSAMHLRRSSSRCRSVEGAQIHSIPSNG